MLRRIVLGGVLLVGVLACSSGGSLNACASLSACCAQAGEMSQSTCDYVLDAQDDAVCASELQNLTTSGACGGDAAMPACSALSQCCLGMTGATASACQNAVKLNEQTSCVAELMAYMSDGTCNGGTGTSTGSSKTSASASSKGSKSSGTSGASTGTATASGTATATASGTATATGSSSK